MALVRQNLANAISIHAPSRERLKVCWTRDRVIAFQSTLPPGSDERFTRELDNLGYFNPRSLTGATPALSCFHQVVFYFNPRSLTGATLTDCLMDKSIRYFNPRSLTGATGVIAL